MFILFTIDKPARVLVPNGSPGHPGGGGAHQGRTLRDIHSRDGHSGPASVSYHLCPTLRVSLSVSHYIRPYSTVPDVCIGVTM